MAKRAYISVANRYAPLDDAQLQGADGLGSNWPAGRSYYDTSRWRAPYLAPGYFQDGSLRGLGALLSSSTENAVDQNAPPDVKRYLIAGEPVPTTRRDITLPFNQVSRLAYGIICVAALGVSYYSYKKFKKKQKGSGNGSSSGGGSTP